MTEITWVGDIKLEVMSTDVEGKQKCKRHNEQLTWEWKKFKKNKLKTEKKDIYMPNQWLLGKKQNKKKNRKYGWKKKKNEKKKWRTIRTLIFYDFWVWDWCVFFVVLFC